MSITTVQQRPPLWSPAYNPIVWQVLSDQVAQFKMKYVFDVYVGAGATGYTRFKVPPNPSGYGTIDISSLVQSSIYINENFPMLSSTPFTTGDNLAVQCYIKVGEEYALTAEGEVQIYNGNGSLGAPAYAVYAANYTPATGPSIPVVAWAAGYDSHEYYNYIGVTGSSITQYEMGPSGGGKFLTTCPTGVEQKMASDSVFTLSWLNYNYRATTPQARVPYVMRTSFYEDGDYVGFEDYYNTTGEGGGPITVCNSAWPGGPTGDKWKLQSFKVDVGELTQLTKDKDAIWGMPVPPYPGWAFGWYSPTADVFPGVVGAGLNPPVSGVSIGSNDDTWLTLSPTNATGSTEIVYKTMDVPLGGSIEIEMGSANAWGTDFPELELWGATGSNLSLGANWSYIDTFTPIENPTNFTYYTLSHTTNKRYYALGLRFKVASPTQYNETLIGPTGVGAPFDCIQKWNITSNVVPGVDYDQICFQLFPKKDNLFNCDVGATGISEEICVTIDDTNCWGFEPIRFTWLNRLGGRDWYTFIKRNTYNQEAERQTFWQLPEYWSGSYSASDNHPARYGTTVFNVSLQNTWTASTDWLTEEESSWLRGMFASPHVLAYLPGRTEPTLVTITDSSYSVQTYAREKLFQYFVSFVEAQPDVVQGY